MATASDLSYDAGLVDTFLHGRDVSFTVQACLDLVEGAGLVFQDWFHRRAYYPPVLLEPDNTFLAAVRALPRRQMWSVMERLNNTKACHLFLACRPERRAETFRVDFTAAAAADFVPLWLTHTEVDGDKVVRHDGWTLTLGHTYAAMIERVDGRRCIRDIAAGVAGSGGDGVEALAVNLFEQLWQLDFLTVCLR